MGPRVVWHKIKLFCLIISVILLLVLTLRNTSSVEIDLLFTTVTMPQAAGLFLAAAIGFLVGLMLMVVLRTRRKIGKGRGSE
jgi:uncharacterized integral membrane protein